MNFGSIDGRGSLNRNRIIKFEKFSDPDWKIVEQERSRSLKMWLRLSLVLFYSAVQDIVHCAGNAHLVRHMFPVLSYLRIFCPWMGTFDTFQGFSEKYENVWNELFHVILQIIFVSYNDNHGQRRRYKRHCKRFDNSCYQYHHQCIANWSAVIMLQVLIDRSGEKRCKNICFVFQHLSLALRFYAGPPQI